MQIPALFTALHSRNTYVHPKSHILEARKTTLFRWWSLGVFPNVTFTTILYTGEQDRPLSNTTTLPPSDKSLYTFS